MKLSLMSDSICCYFPNIETGTHNREWSSRAWKVSLIYLKQFSLFRKQEGSFGMWQRIRDWNFLCAFTLLKKNIIYFQSYCRTQKIVWEPIRGVVLSIYIQCTLDQKANWGQNHHMNNTSPMPWISVLSLM